MYEEQLGWQVYHDKQQQQAAAAAAANRAATAPPLCIHTHIRSVSYSVVKAYMVPNKMNVKKRQTKTHTSAFRDSSPRPYITKGNRVIPWTTPLFANVLTYVLTHSKPICTDRDE